MAVEMTNYRGPAAGHNGSRGRTPLTTAVRGIFCGKTLDTAAGTGMIESSGSGGKIGEVF